MSLDTDGDNDADTSVNCLFAYKICNTRVYFAYNK